MTQENAWAEGMRRKVRERDAEIERLKAEIESLKSGQNPKSPAGGSVGSSGQGLLRTNRKEVMTICRMFK